MKSILYGCCYKADLNKKNITYVDIIPGLKKTNKCKYICEDIRNINFNNYDLIICSPPCNYYSRANWRRDKSLYALTTKDLLPYCINAAYKTNKPFIIENVRNKNMMFNLDIPKDIFIYEFGRHTYFTNIMIDLTGLPQIFDNIRFTNTKKRQGGFNVNTVFNYWLEYVEKL